MEGKDKLKILAVDMSLCMNLPVFLVNYPQLIKTIYLLFSRVTVNSLKVSFTTFLILSKCFSTLEERAQRLFSTKGKGSLDPSLMKKANKGKASKDKEQLRHRELATLEAQVYR